MKFLASLPFAAALALTSPQPSNATHTPLPARKSTMPTGTAVKVNLLSRLAPDADPKVLDMALQAVHCAQTSGVATDAQRLAVIDYSRPSLQPRLWVFDLHAGKLLYEEVVAHGQGSGDNYATRFSNRDGSHQSSLGLFVTTDTYIGRNGFSLRMDGLEPGINDRAMSRAIVMHGAPYVNPIAGKAMGRLGRSWGCPAVRTTVAKPMLELLKRGQFVFSYYPDPAWLERSRLLNCGVHASTAPTSPRQPLRNDHA
ncbi:L,D-transpeptidase-like protein [Luteimonas cucumeris]|uniref:L,D-transpeptidase-like protein n=2 Tax=Luteimonas cucumeris TaxID=985012 RepID=A0A562LBF9_9GAMM|nr:L,D-transpeptidase-like protein [Luteimonas cucumeris]